MSRQARIMRLVSGVLFIGAGIMTYVAFDKSRMVNLVALLFIAIGLTNFLLIFILSRFFPQFFADDE